MQIFGRAGRPQFDTSGEGVIITTHEKLAHYLRLMTHQLPIESQFIAALRDNLNAEVVLGTVTTIKEAITWLSYTYLSVRMRMSAAAPNGDSRSLSLSKMFIIVGYCRVVTLLGVYGHGLLARMHSL